MLRRLELEAVPGTFAICKFPPDSRFPEWATSGPFFSVTRTREELSIIVTDGANLTSVERCERGWRMLRVAGEQAFTLTGVLNSVLEPLAQAEISIFAISTFDTDYVMVKAEALERATAVLKAAGHRVQI